MSPIKFKICKDEDCEKSFTPFSSTQKYCSYECTLKNQKPSKRRAAIKQKSKKQEALDKLYTIVRKKFLSQPENKFCAVYPKRLATEIHHKAGRIGKLLFYIPFFLPVSSEGHRCIHENPKKSYELNFMIKRTTVKIK